MSSGHRVDPVEREGDTKEENHPPNGCLQLSVEWCEVGFCQSQNKGHCFKITLGTKINPRE